jgi:DNA-binding MarR family transcriptional regulator
MISSTRPKGQLQPDAQAKQKLQPKRRVKVPAAAPAAAADVDTAPRLRAVVGKPSRRLRPTLAGSGLTPTRLSVLATLDRRGPMRISELASIEGLNPTMLSRVIAELAESGLLQRVPDPDDGRAALVDATAAGRRLHKMIQNERNDVLSVLLAELDAHQHRELVDALGVLEEIAERLKRRPV